MFCVFGFEIVSYKSTPCVFVITRNEPSWGSMKGKAGKQSFSGPGFSTLILSPSPPSPSAVPCVADTYFSGLSR